MASQIFLNYNKNKHLPCRRMSAQCTPRQGLNGPRVYARAIQFKHRGPLTPAWRSPLKVLPRNQSLIPAMGPLGTPSNWRPPLIVPARALPMPPVNVQPRVILQVDFEVQQGELAKLVIGPACQRNG